MDDIFRQGKEFIEGIKPGSRVVVIMDTDADGLAGARIVEYVLERRGIQPVLIFPGKGEWAYSEQTIKSVRSVEPEYIIAVDTGSSVQNPYAPIPTLVIDHHYPLGGKPRDIVFCSSYGRKPVETASLISYLIGKEITDLTPIEWVVLLGVIGDLGDTKEFPFLEPLVKKYTKTQVRKAVGLLNSARRASSCDVSTAYQALREASSPRDIVEGRSPLIEKLRQYKDELQSELEKARRSRPFFAGENVAVCLDSGCLVQGIIASIWANKFPKYRCLAANKGYLPGEIVFNLRTRRQDNLIDYLHNLLKDCKIEGSYGYGHNKATGGRMSPESFILLLKKMGFSEEVVKKFE
ncbi:DHH family phosphoesterase [Candidatus Sumerlaeota bacterium]|nr:DHH family phosphoesterase [Candidatus Sumerlaeota bacterium]